MRRYLTAAASARAAAFFCALICTVAADRAFALGDKPAVMFAEFDLPAGAEGRTAPVRVAYPRAGRDLLLVGFSHGANSDNGQYDRIAEPLAQAGYVIVLPTHLDSETNPDREGLNPADVLRTRIEDMTAALSAHDALRGEIPDLAGRLADGPVAAAGHSYGALIAQLMGGAAAMYGVIRAPFDAVAAVVAISPPGALPNFVGPESFADFDAPMLVTTGTGDVLPGFMDDWRMHLMSHEAAPAGDQFALYSDGVDHYFGNVIGRLSLPGPPQEEGFAVAAAAAAAFLEAYLRGDSAAWRAFRDTQIDGETHVLLER